MLVDEERHSDGRAFELGVVGERLLDSGVDGETRRAQPQINYLKGGQRPHGHLKVEGPRRTGLRARIDRRW